MQKKEKAKKWRIDLESWTSHFFTNYINMGKYMTG